MSHKLKIYLTADMHGYLYPTNFASPDKRPMGSIAAGQSFVKDENTLIIDGGDTIQGSPLTYFCYSNDVHLPTADVLNAAQYDYVTLGNHDFNQGYDVLKAYLGALDATCLCANVSDNTGAMEILPYCIHTLGNGVKVGLIGIATDWIKRWERPEHIENLTITSPLEAARAAVDALKGKVDLLVGIYHGGLEKDVKTGKLLADTDENIACLICEELPLDILLTGHQHVAMAQIDYMGTHIVQTPCNATQYTVVEVDEAGKITSSLHTPIADPVLTTAQQALYAELTEWLDGHVGYLSRALWPEDRLTMALHGSAIASFFNRVQLDETKADISCASLANDIRGFAADVTVRDVVASYVYSNTLGVYSVTAHYNYDFFSGIDYVFDLSRPLRSRVVKLERNGVPIGDEDKFTLCMNNYRASGVGGFDAYLDCPLVQTFQRDMSEVILDYFGRYPRVEIEDENNFHCIGYKA